jgi:hypothetical protein
MIWAKFPHVCAYCHKREHSQPECDKRRSSSRLPDWEELKKIGDTYRFHIPTSLSGWQQMFREIYPRGDMTSREKNFSRLVEELGELGESLRILPITRAYFVSEAPDVFAWLMGAANEMEFDLQQEEQKRRNRLKPHEQKDEAQGAFLEQALVYEYPQQCKHCGSKLCKCSPILRSKLGRIAHEAPNWLLSGEEGGRLFTVEDALDFFRLGDEAISLGGKNIPVTHEVIDEVRKTSHLLLDSIKNASEFQADLRLRLEKATAELETLASQQKVTQESVDALVSVIQDMPLEPKNKIIGFLENFATNIAAGVWLPVLLKAVKQ